MPALTPQLVTPATAPDLALRRFRPTLAAATAFAQARAALLAALNPAETEENAKTHVRDFLRTVLGASTYYVNTSTRRDLVIRTGPREADAVGVVIEAKAPANKAEMVTPTDLNRRAFHELLLYYLEDRAAGAANHLRRLVITNGAEWFIFDALDFDRLFWRNPDLQKQFKEYKAKSAASATTTFFYDKIAKPFLAQLADVLPTVYVNLSTAPTSPTATTQLWRLFSAFYLLKEPVSQDANTLNRGFYEELLYLIGLEERKDGGRKLIERCAPARRQPGSLLENTLTILESEDGLAGMLPADLAAYGETPDQQRTGVALALCLTWVNRLLFLKLLEGQLRRYHAAAVPADSEAANAFRFLTPARLPDYDAVQKLFFRVLNTPVAARTPDVAAAFREVPYLNSSLFEKSLLERQASISNLEDRLALPLSARSVLRAATPKTAPPPEALAYLLRFLDAYDFASDPATDLADGADPDQPRPDTATPRPLISAAVLGLIFEKINGYQDGSFYTPGFVTMYIARHTLRRAVVRHFQRRAAALPGGGALADVTTVEELAERLKPADRLADARYFNQLTVCDPAVGSGHFLVSALNELLACKAALGLLLESDQPTPDGKPPRKLPYHLRVLNDELVVTDYDDQPFPYRVGTYHPATGARTVGQQHTALQRALFREKRALMEHALFGVDLNPNSVRICQLRLWIELLKHAYYRPDSQCLELETLPNLELNIRAGNSLLSRFALTEDLTDVFRRQGSSLRAYRDAVSAYFSASGTQAKTDLMGLLTRYRENFREVIHRRDPLRLKISRTRGERDKLEMQGALFPETAKQREDREWESRRMTLLLEQQEAELTAREQGALFRDAFEWRFEFPEILDEKGTFRGFDVVVGNPPYIRADEQPAAFRKALLQSKRFETLSEKWDLYVPFLELGHQLLRPGGLEAMIVPDAYCHAKYARTSQDWFLKNATVERLDFLGQLKVFDDAAVNNVIPFFEKRPATADDQPARRVHVKEFGQILELETGPQSTLTYRAFLPENASEDTTADADSVPLEEICYISVGMVPHADEKVALGAFTLGDLVQKTQDATHPKPFIEGKQLTDWHTIGNNWLEWGTARAPALFRRTTFPDLYTAPEKLMAMRIVGQRVRVCLDDRQLLCNHTVIVLVPWGALEGVRNGSLKKTAQYDDEVRGARKVPNRTVLEAESRQFDLRYLLAVMHSSPAWQYLQRVRRSNTDLYPDDWKRLPIPRATPAQQAEIAEWVRQVLAAKAATPPQDTTALEAQIDAAVAGLYGLSAAGAVG